MAGVARLTRWRAVLPHVMVLALGLLLAVVMTYPLAAQVRDHLASVADQHDPICFVWNNWWIQHALVDLHRKPYLTDYLLVPFPLDLRLHTLGLLYGLMSIPFVAWFGPIAVVNLQILATPALNAYAVFLMIRRWVGRADVAVVCGGVLGIAPAVTFHLAAGRPSCAAIWPLALAQLFLLRLIEDPGWRNGLGLTAALWALLAVDQQMSLFGGLFLGLTLGAAVMRQPGAIFNRRFVTCACVVLLLVAYPFRILYVRPFLQTPGYTTPDPSETLVYSVPLAMFVRPDLLWRTYGLLLPLGLVVGIALARTDRRAAFGVLCALLGLVLTLGPVVSGTTIPLPFALLRRIPGFAMFRTPYRFQVLAALGMTVALAASLTHWLRRPPPRRFSRAARATIVGTLILLVIVDATVRRAAYGFATHPVAIEPIYQKIAQTPGDFVVLEIPVGVHSGSELIGRGDDLMLAQVVHGKRLINGYLSRVPRAALDYYRRSPAFMFLANEKPAASDDVVAADLDRRMEDLHVGFIVVHPEMLDRDRLDAIRRLLARRTDLQPIATGTTTLAFRVARVD